MEKHLKILILFVFAIITVSCKKDKQKNLISLVKTINDGSRIDTLMYDSQNRLTERHVGHGSIYTYSYYLPDSVVSHTNGKRSGVATYNTFKQHKQTIRTALGNPSEIYYGYNFAYNAPGNLVYHSFNNYTHAGAIDWSNDSLYYSDNNCNAFVHNYRNSSGTFNSYRLTKNFLNKKNTLKAENFGLKFNDAHETVYTLRYDDYMLTALYDEQLVSEVINRDGTVAVRFEYEFDNKDRVTKRIRYYNYGSPDYVEIFTYY